jgi:methylenetetrahydrofolate dehydrogenase (NADP+) / methenyltetrahydrofolate cyclohydrolase
MSPIESSSLIDGAALSRQLLADTAARARRFEDRVGRSPSLVALLVGETPHRWPM